MRLLILAGILHTVTSQNFTLGIIDTIGNFNNTLNNTKIQSQFGITLFGTLLKDVNIGVYDFGNEACHLLSENTIGLISYVDCFLADYVDWFEETYDFPSIQFISTDCDHRSTKKDSLKMLPNCREKNKVVVRITMEKAWNDVTVLKDFSVDESCVMDLVDRMTAATTSTTVISVNASDTLEEFLEMIHYQGERRIISFMSDELDLVLLNKASEFKMFSKEFYWIIFPENTTFSNTNVEGLYNGFVLMINMAIHGGTNTDSTCFHQSNFSKTNNLLLMDAISVFNVSLHNVIHNGSLLLADSFTFDCHADATVTNRKILKDFMKDVHTPGNTGDISWTENGYRKEISYEIFSARNESGSYVGFHSVAFYETSSDHLQIYDQRLFLNEFKDFGNRTITVVSVPAPPFNIKNTRNNNSFYYTGFCYDILNDFAETFNFRYVTVESIDGTYGGPTSDGTDATGMVGMVMRGEADIGVAPFTITATRDEVVDFLTPFQEEGVGIIMKKPDPNANRMFKMFLPFQYSVWVTIVATMIFIGFLQYIVHRLSPYNKARLRLVDALWMSFGAYVGQGGEHNPTFPSGRVILGVWWMFTIVVLALYTANLAAFLTITLAKTPIKNIAELSAQTEYKPLVKEGTNLISLFQNAESGTYAKIWTMMSGMPVVKTTDDAYDMVLSEPYAFMTDVSQLEYRALTDCQNVDIAEETFNKAGLSFLVRENAPFLEAFNAHMIRMLEAGLIAKYRSNWWPSNSACNEASYTTAANSLDLDSIAGLYFVYCGMIALSLIFLFIEIILRKFYREVKILLFRKRRVTNSTQELSQGDENSLETS